MSFNSALSGLTAASNELQVIGNNVANASTTGFKRSRAEFADVYAASSLDISNTSIGSGVIMTSVTQQFSQGGPTNTENSLDLMVNGEGFFVLEDNGNQVYSRAGAFGKDRENYVVNAQGFRLQGYLADESGNITVNQGSMRVPQDNLSPNATTDVRWDFNLPANAEPPTVQFQRGFTATNPPDTNSFNHTQSTSVVDSLGNTHTLTSYFVKVPAERTWHVFLGLDGNDVTPTDGTVPTGTPPLNFGTDTVARPFTLQFDTSGALIPNNPIQPAVFYGSTPVVSTTPAFTNTNSLATLDTNELTLNGIRVDATVAESDKVSTVDKRGSAISLAAAINSGTNQHGVTATPETTTIDLGIPTLGALASGDFTINGIEISGAVANDAALLTLINDQSSITGVGATQPGGAGTAVILSATDGRNIQLQTDGTTAGATFANFNLNGGAALDQTQAAAISLSTVNNNSITVGGTNPGGVGLPTGPIAGIIQPTSDVLSIDNWDPATGAALQSLQLDFANAKQHGSDFAVSFTDHNGYATGKLAGLNVEADGTIIARYSNGQSTALGQVLLATFGNVQGLSPQGDTSWVETFSSGAAIIGRPQTASLGAIQGKALEDSNVELTDELVAMIVAQRNFQASAQTIKTADAVTQSIINLR